MERRQRQHRRQRKQEPSDLPNRTSPHDVGRKALPPRPSVIYLFVVGDAGDVGDAGVDDPRQDRLFSGAEGLCSVGASRWCIPG